MLKNNRFVRFLNLFDNEKPKQKVQEVKQEEWKKKKIIKIEKGNELI